jgi:site-specific DNA-cytosine methylase
MNERKGLNVLSLFDGLSCGQIALNRLGYTIAGYFASEIDKHAIKVTQANFPNTTQLGDVKDITVTAQGIFVKGVQVSHLIPNLLIGGSPCQGFSFAGKQLNFDDPRSALFFEFARIWEEIKKANPKAKFFLENVRMKKEYQDVISGILGVEPIYVDSIIVSGQTRKRLYWTNIEGFVMPEDKGINLSDIIESGDVDRDKAYCLDANYFKGTNASQYLCKARRQIVWVIPEATKKGYIEVSNGQFVDLTFIKSKTRRGRLMINKSNCLTAASYNYCKVTNDWFRKLTPVECERLQTVPDNYTAHVSDSHRYKMLGNGWTVDAVCEFFKHIEQEL